MIIKQLLGGKLAPAVVAIAIVAATGGVATASAEHGAGFNWLFHHHHDGGSGYNGYNKDQCKDGGWETFKLPNGKPMFKNQGQCVSFFEHQGHDGDHDGDDHGHGNGQGKGNGDDHGHGNGNGQHHDK